MFDTIAGLPLHPLAVHAVVVLLPLMSVVTFLVALRPSWRGAAVPVVVADALVFIASFVARQTGEQLQRRLRVIRGGAQVAATHGQEGAVLPLFALAVLVAGVVLWLSVRRPNLTTVAIVLAAVTGLAAIGWTIVVGDSGARDVWSGVVSSAAGR